LNLNAFKKNHKAKKINNNIKNILSANEKIKKTKIKHDTNIYNIFKTEKDVTKNKINYIPITSRDKQTNRSRNMIFENNNTNTKIESNTVYLDLSPNPRNNMLSAKQDQRKEILNQRNSVYSKDLIFNRKKKK